MTIFTALLIFFSIWYFVKQNQMRSFLRTSYWIWKCAQHSLRVNEWKWKMQKTTWKRHSKELNAILNLTLPPYIGRNNMIQKWLKLRGNQMIKFSTVVLKNLDGKQLQEPMSKDISNLRPSSLSVLSEPSWLEESMLVWQRGFFLS